MIGLALSLLASPCPRQDSLPTGTEYRVHDVATLTGAGDLDRLRVRLRSAGPDPLALGGDLRAFVESRERVEHATERLLQAVRSTISPELSGGQRVEALDAGHVGLLGDAAQQAWMADFLAGFATFRGRIEVRVRVWDSVPEDALPGSWGTTPWSLLNENEEVTLIAALDRAGAAPTVAPVAVVAAWSPSELFVGEEHPYVRDWDVKVLPGGREVLVPLLDVLREGHSLRVTAAPLASGSIALELHLTCRRLIALRPFTTTLHEKHEVDLDLPETRDVTFRGAFHLPRGETLLLLSPDAGETKALVLLSARRAPE